MVQARITPELREKVNADMARLGIRNESEYVRMLLLGTVTGDSNQQDTKELLTNITEEISVLEEYMQEFSVRFKDINYELAAIKRKIENLRCSPDWGTG